MLVELAIIWIISEDKNPFDFNESSQVQRSFLREWNLWVLIILIE